MKKQTLLISGLIISMFIWGMSWPSGKILSQYGSAVSIAFLRFLLTFLSLFPLLLFFKEPLRIKKEGILPLLAASFCMSAYSYFFFNGLKYGFPGAGGVLVTTLNPVVSYTLGLIISKRKPNRNESLGLAIGVIAGCVLLKIWDNPLKVFEAGNLFFLLASFTWSILSKFTSKASNYGTSPAFSVWMYLLCSFIIILFCSPTELATVFYKADSVFWLNLFFSAVITTTFATSFFFYSTSELGAEKASSYIFLVPLSAALSSFFFLNEVLLWNTLAGGILGAIAVFIINKK